MDEKKLKSLEKFINEKLPEPERDRIIMIVDGKYFSWKMAIEALKKGDNLANKIEKRFEEMAI